MIVPVFTVGQSKKGNCISGDCINGRGVYIEHYMSPPPTTQEELDTLSEEEIEERGLYEVGGYSPLDSVFEYTITYKGNFVKGKKHGAGSECVSDEYIGESEDFVCGRCYRGQWKKGKKHGKGISIYYYHPFWQYYNVPPGTVYMDSLQYYGFGNVFNSWWGWDGHGSESNQIQVWDNGELKDTMYLNNKEQVYTKYAKTITKKDLKKHLTIIASDSMEGRETGKPGQKMAADYIMNHFKEIGIPPYKKQTYYQKFKLKRRKHICKCEDCDTDFIKRMMGKNKYIKGENVLGYIEGSDLKEELIVITAHYDHLGKHEEKIYNGADDDGSGTVALMEIAEAFMIAKKEGNGPRRSVLLMAVSGEEKGLLGSKYYTDNPQFPLEKTVANLNIDMIGRIDDWHDHGNYIYLIGSDMLSKDLHDLSEKVNYEYIKGESPLSLDYTYNAKNDPNRYYYRSDHYNFAKNNIPVIFYFNGIHEDYHKTTDTIEKIDFDKTRKITKLIFLTAWEIVNRDERVKLDKN